MTEWIQSLRKFTKRNRYNNADATTAPKQHTPFISPHPETPEKYQISAKAHTQTHHQQSPQTEYYHHHFKKKKEKRKRTHREIPNQTQQPNLKHQNLS